AEAQWPDAKWLLYPLKTIATGLCLWWLRGQFKELSWHWSWWGIVIGVVVVVQWVGMEEFFKAYWHYPALPVIGAEADWNMEKVFNPETYFGGRNLSFWVWIAFRMAGAVIVVPIMEELFWRGFMLRLLVGRYFERVQLGEFSWFSCLATAGLFALMHPWYISAFACALIYNWLMYKTKSMLACMVAHALTNLLLWVYILNFDAWWLG
ncbi:MAG: CAAX prenyl protease-related protein, partial [Actinobacteria bacterium]|nr:CAAX prenyl protease-related protein [Actinomycetota bacterium]